MCIGGLGRYCGGVEGVEGDWLRGVEVVVVQDIVRFVVSFGIVWYVVEWRRG